MNQQLRTANGNDNGTLMKEPRSSVDLRIEKPVASLLCLQLRSVVQTSVRT
jgi:hypothetical protein